MADLNDPTSGSPHIGNMYPSLLYLDTFADMCIAESMDSDVNPTPATYIVPRDQLIFGYEARLWTKQKMIQLHDHQPGIDGGDFDGFTVWFPGSRHERIRPF